MTIRISSVILRAIEIFLPSVRMSPTQHLFDVTTSEHIICLQQSQILVLLLVQLAPVELETNPLQLRGKFTIAR